MEQALERSLGLVVGLQSLVSGEKTPWRAKEGQ